MTFDDACVFTLMQIRCLLMHDVVSTNDKAKQQILADK
ncbi:hypothetical protein T11_2875 [Trichinella zimbabwensis]|uniref:Uncharacterized protein n=1 Tax=Trichinella zimbabwensis TaxID=268475 RepID=A0A0V1GJN6_9BILA|nr:hypothetical protein T11_2875 [Trichinella zimbabwensis]